MVSIETSIKQINHECNCTVVVVGILPLTGWVVSCKSPEVCSTLVLIVREAAGWPCNCQ